MQAEFRHNESGGRWPNLRINIDFIFCVVGSIAAQNLISGIYVMISVNNQDGLVK